MAKYLDEAGAEQLNQLLAAKFDTKADILSVPTKTSQLTNDANFITNTGSTSGNAGTATKLQTSKTIAIGTGATGTATSFDGSANITIPITETKEAYASWGGKSISGGITPVDSGCIDEFGHNKLAFLPAGCIVVEYTTDGGATWLDYELTDSQKIALVTTSGPTMSIGKGTVSAKNGTLTNENCSNYKVRVTISTRIIGQSSGSLYTQAKKWLINVNTNGASGSQVLIEHRTIGNYNNNVNTWSKVGTYNVAGWSGWNSIPYSWYFGGSSSQTSQIGQIRFTLSIQSVNTAHTCQCSFLDFRLIGATNWTMPSEMARVGHLYTVDTDKNATFPGNINPQSNNTKTLGTSSLKWNNVYATTFTGNLTGNVTGTATKATGDKNGNDITTTYYKASNPNGYTSNTGTITGVSVNGTSVATSGVANITSIPASILSGAIPSAVTATTQTQGDNSTKIATTAFVQTAIDNLPEPMVFKGSLGTGGTITALPIDGSADIGDTYKVITAGTYASKAAKIGDTFICLTKTSNANTWEIIPSGDEPSGTVTSVTIKATSPIAIDSSSAITTSGTRTLSHANSGVTAGTYKSVTVNATGHITAGTNPTTLSGYGITDAEASANKVTSLSSSSTDTQYPSAKLLYDKLALKQNNLTAGANIDITNNTISVDGEVLTPLADGSIRIWDLNTGVYSLTDNSISTIYYNGATSTSGTLGVYGGLLFVYSLTSSTKAWFFMSDNQTDPYFYLGSMTSSSGSITRLMKKSEIVNNLTTTAEGYMLDARQGKTLNDAMEKKSNKVTSISSSSTNTQYPSAKLLYDQLIAAKQLGTAVTATNNNFTIYGKETGLYFITPASGSYLTVYAGDVLDPSKRIEIAYDCTIWITKDSSDPTNYSHFMGIGCAKIEDPDEETDFIYSPIVFYGTASQNDPNNKVILIPLKVQQLNKKVTSWSSTPLHNNYPSEKLVYNSLALKQNQITYSTTDLVEGSATLATGELYVVYE